MSQRSKNIKSIISKSTQNASNNTNLSYKNVFPNIYIQESYLFDNKMKDDLVQHNIKNISKSLSPLLTAENKKSNNIQVITKNINYKKYIKDNQKKLRYQPLTSFEQKLSKELGRLSHKYNYETSRRIFNSKLNNTNLYWKQFPDFKIYRLLKELEGRKDIPSVFNKPRLKPLINVHKDKLGVLAKNIYEKDQIERFKKYLYDHHKIKIVD